MKKSLIVVTLLAAAAAAWYFFAVRDRAGAAPEFITVPVSRGDVVQTVTATGQLDPLITVDVGSQISGLVQKLYVDFNSPVKKGDKLAEIDPATYEQRLRQAQANLASAEASARLQRINSERVKALYDQKLVTQQEYDQALVQLQQAEAQLLTSKAQVENAIVDLERCTITSPIDGIVMSKQTEEGKTVAASLNAPVLFTIANDLSKMQITAAVAEADIGAVEAGQQVRFTVDAFPNRTFRGEVVQVRNAPKTTSNVVTYDTIINVDNSDLRLRPGMTANVSIIVARRSNTLRVPNAALRVRVPDNVNVIGAAPASSAKGASRSAKSENSASPAREGGGPSAREGRGGGRRNSLLAADATPEQRQAFREIITEVGVDFRSGPPSPEQRDLIKKMMTDRGLPIAESAEQRGEQSPVTTRTVYLLRSSGATPSIEAVQVKAGITDGSTTEIISGLNEGDPVVTSIIVPVSGGSPQRPASTPFGGGPRRF